MSIEKHYFLISQKIDGEDNYFCKWERLHPTSQVFGIIWDTDIDYARIFIRKIDAKKERSRMIHYDKRGKYIVVPMTEKTLRKLGRKLVYVK